VENGDESPAPKALTEEEKKLKKEKEGLPDFISSEMNSTDSIHSSLPPPQAPKGVSFSGPSSKGRGDEVHG